MIDYRVFVKQVVHLLVLVDWGRRFDIVGQVRCVHREMFGDLGDEGVCEGHGNEHRGLIKFADETRMST